VRGRLFAAVLLLLAAAAAPAQEGEYPVSDRERAAWEAVELEGALVRGRELTEGILARQPDSFVALYLMAVICRDADANLPRAAFYASRARAVIEGRWGDPVPDDGPWRWHALALRLLIEVTLQMDREEQALELLAFRDARYEPPMTVEYGWPLMKLGRIAEARALMNNVVGQGTLSDRLHALNTLGAMESELDNPEAAYRAFERLLDEYERAGEAPTATALRNAGQVAATLLRFDEAERRFLEATAAFDPGSYSNPWQDLARLWMGQGRFGEAVDAMLEMQRWSRGTAPALDQQSWSERQAVVASLLLEAGRDDDAIRLARQVLARPDRRAGTSGYPDQESAGQLLLLCRALGLRRARLAEEASWLPLADAWRARWRRLADGVDRWRAGRRAAALVVDHRRLAPSLRYLAPDGVSADGLAAAELVMAVGPGVIAVEAERLLGRTSPAALRERPYLLLSHGESLVRRDRAAAAEVALEEAAATLPQAEVLLRARAAILRGIAAEATGDRTGAVARYQEALALHPPELRALGAALPVTLADDGTAAAREAARLLARSPRFAAGKRGFVLRVGASGQGLAALLLAPDGAVLANVEVAAAPDALATARAIAAELHRRAFAVRLDLSQTDVASLEGGTLTGRDLREAVGELLGR